MDIRTGQPEEEDRCFYREHGPHEDIENTVLRLFPADCTSTLFIFTTTCTNDLGWEKNSKISLFPVKSVSAWKVKNHTSWRVSVAEMHSIGIESWSCLGPDLKVWPGFRLKSSLLKGDNRQLSRLWRLDGTSELLGDGNTSVRSLPPVNHCFPPRTLNFFPTLIYTICFAYTSAATRDTPELTTSGEVRGQDFPGTNAQGICLVSKRHVTLPTSCWAPQSWGILNFQPKTETLISGKLLS